MSQVTKISNLLRKAGFDNHTVRLGETDEYDPFVTAFEITFADLPMFKFDIQTDRSYVDVSLVFDNGNSADWYHQDIPSKPTIKAAVEAIIAARAKI